jgi:hypothetical protein
MHPTNCLNCEALLTADDHYCPNCGQKTDTHRLTIGHIAHEFFHSFVHTDKGFLGMIADLAVKPGLVAKEYVAGKRKKYFNPFTFFILSIGILAFSSHLFKTIEQRVEADQRVLAQLPATARVKYLKVIERTNESAGFINKNFNTVAMLVLPLYAFLSWAFFGRRKYNYSEVFVAYMLFQSFVSLFLAIFVIPFVGKYKGYPFFFYAYAGVLILTSVYVGIAQYRFFNFKNRFSIVLTSLASLLGYLLVFLILVVCIFYYVYRSKM